jgi:hypothetical protein
MSLKYFYLRKAISCMMVVCSIMYVSCYLNAGNIENDKTTEIELLQVHPVKLFTRTGTPVKGFVKIKNHSKRSIKLDIRIWLTNDLKTITGVKNKQVDLAAGKTTQVDFEWKPGLVKKYGHAMVVEIRQNGKVIARGEDYFTTAENVWEVGIAGNHPRGYTADRLHSKNDTEAVVDVFRKKYVNSFEKFFWAPDDFAEMTPDKDIWYSGQARYHESKKWNAYMAQYGSSIGVIPTTYGKSIGGGSAARNVILKNPEMVYGFGGKISYFPDTEELSKWDVEGKDSSKWQSTGWAMYNMNDPATVQKGITEIINSSKMFGWEGVRFDGHFTARIGKQYVGGKIIDFDKEMADKQTASNMRNLKQQVKKVYPQYVFGYNFAECRFATRLEDSPREAIELCKDGGHIMDEYAKTPCGEGSHPWSTWFEYAAGILKESIEVRRLGGQLFPMIRHTRVCNRYQVLFTLAAGAHPNLDPRSSHVESFPYLRFATRYAGFLWHKDMKYIWCPAGLVIAPPSLMWENYVREIPIDNKRKYLLIHLINPPVQQSGAEAELQEKEIVRREKLKKEIKEKANKNKADYSQLDKLAPIKLFPESQKNIDIKIVPQAMNNEWDLINAHLLNADDMTQKTITIDKSDPYFWRTTIPEVKFWSILVVELKKK